MKVLVTGATGFVGSAITRSLLAHGHAVLGLVRDPMRAQALEKAGATLAVGQMERPDTYRPLVAQVDAVIHAAQAKPAGRWTRRRIAAMHDSDALMARTLANACLEQQKLFVYTSGALAHAGNGDEWITEATPLRPCLLAKGHADMVRELSELHVQRGLRVQFISPGFVYGAGGFFPDMMDMMRRRRYRVIGKGTNYWGLVHIDDLGELYALALERGRPGAHYFVADDEPLRRREVIDRTTDTLGLPRCGSMPRWLAGLWFGFPLVEAINTSIRMRNDLAKKELGWTPRYRTLSDGLPGVLKQMNAT